jgi:predicted RecB family nuclease
LDSLEAQDRQVYKFEGVRDHLTETLAAMRRGEQIIYQGYLEYGKFGGYPDFLVRVDRPSQVGAWSYEPWDTKLARHPKPYFLIQLCAYADLLESLQGVRPSNVRVVLGTHCGVPATADFRADDFFFYYASLKSAFLEQQETFDAYQRPEIPPLIDLGRWTGYSERELQSRDDLQLVANIRSSQIRRLRAAGIQTMAQLAAVGERPHPSVSVSESLLQHLSGIEPKQDVVQFARIAAVQGTGQYHCTLGTGSDGAQGCSLSRISLQLMYLVRDAVIEEPLEIQANHVIPIGPKKSRCTIVGTRFTAQKSDW